MESLTETERENILDYIYESHDYFETLDDHMKFYREMSEELLLLVYGQLLIIDTTEKYNVYLPRR
jgi:hypothetical protein